ncbi:MAG: DUF2799 domain-containing protein [Woeseiaceae bacterium]|nr:DUF2799 domain-containing protein [Woeseiaceae bacterium]
MKRLYTAILVPGILLGLGGCASMSADECMLSDWHTIGYEDGARGYTADRLGEHRKACAKHGVAPDLEAYRAGRADGLREFCQPSRGFNLGAAGGRYYGVCSADMEPDFLDAYRNGQHLHTLRSNVQATNNAILAREADLEQVKQRVRNAEAALISRETTTEERILLLADLKDMSEETGQLEAEISVLIEERAMHESQLASYEAVLANSGY